MIVVCIFDFVFVMESEKMVRKIIEVMLGKDYKGVMLEMCYNLSFFIVFGVIVEKEGW